MSKRVRFLLVGVALLIPAGRASARLVAQWPFEEGSGKTVADVVGGGGNGTVAGNPPWGLGVSGGAIGFDGSGQYVRIATNSVVQLRSSSAYTVATWVKVQGTLIGFILFHGEGCSAWGSWFLGVGGGEGDAVRQPGKLVFGVRQANGSDYTSVAAPLAPDKWVHVAATYDGTTLAFYIDGKQADSVAAPQPYDNTNPFYIGGDPGCGGRVWFTGMIDDLRIYDQALSAGDLQEVLGNSGASSKPTPAPWAVDVAHDVVLGWKSGKFAKTHDVYFGTAFDDVNNATTGSPRGVLASRGQDASTFEPAAAGPLAFNQPYYWRVDEVNAPPTQSTVFKGPVWSFTTETYGYPVKPTKATASSSSNAQMGPEKTIDGSGLDALDQHGTSATQMWLSKKNQSPIWIQYEFDKAYKLYQMWVWNSNQAVEGSVGFGAKDVTVETSLDGTTWTALAGVPEFADGTGEPNYTHGTTVDFAGVQAKFVKLTITSNWAGTTKQAGLSEVRFFYVPVKAFSPTPAARATDVAIDSVLNWRPGRQAVRHDVYFGTDPNALALAQTVTSHKLTLSSLGAEYGRTYYWKVTEVNDAATPPSWEGDLWSFSTQDFAVVEDFESYDDACNRVYYAWADGLGYSASSDCGMAASTGNGTGSTVGNSSAPYAEPNIVHGGQQSMPFGYDNTSKASSEAVHTFGSPQDWTMGGAKILVLFFRGVSDNVPGQLYLKINNVRVDYKGNAAALALPMWTQWNVDLASLSGVNPKAISTLAIGVSGSGKGELYVDDIRLYRSAPAALVPTDPGTAGLVVYYPFEGDAKDASGKGNDGTLNGGPVFEPSRADLGQALVFDGADDYVDLPIGSLVNKLDSITVATWLNATGQNYLWQRIFASASADTASYIFLTSDGGLHGVLQFGISTGGSAGEVRVTAPRALPTPTGWHHAAGVIDGETKTLLLYLDGELVASGPTSALPSNLAQTTQNTLGRNLFSGTPYTESWYKGSLDEFRIYTRVLSVGEVRYLAGAR